ncbi:hypothetical protein GCM10011374_24950 [Kocuria dechangensis]|uniref:Uncharacterized protein n=1 Tax=Kocuria dechangensis TaxID=1176249 RepID=A0A917GY35_9MICC|nr:hypothetical protein GCM10011374_24950 [Kocuria dechangensis]
MLIAVGMALFVAAILWQLGAGLRRRRRARRAGEASRPPATLTAPAVLGPLVLIVTGAALLATAALV